MRGGQRVRPIALVEAEGRPILFTLIPIPDGASVTPSAMTDEGSLSSQVNFINNIFGGVLCYWSKKNKKRIFMKNVKNVSLTDLRSNPEMLLTTAQVKNVLGVSNPTLFRWRKAHVIPCYKVGGVYKYKANEIINYLNENEL